jgi:hypothetical protein
MSRCDSGSSAARSSICGPGLDRLSRVADPCGVQHLHVSGGLTTGRASFKRAIAHRVGEFSNGHRTRWVGVCRDSRRMTNRHRSRTIVRWLATAAGVAVTAYGTYVGVTWFSYGHPIPAVAGDDDPLLDRFMPAYEVVDRHQTWVEAPAAVTFAVARTIDLFEMPVVRAIIRGRELVMGATTPVGPRPRGLLAEAQSLGWVVLAENPGRELVMGAVTRPWEANVTFRSLAPDAFAAFAEPGYVKIAWTLRADPSGPTGSVFRTETRAIATDAAARKKFRRYWSFLSPGIVLIRRVALAPLKAQAEQRGRQVALTATH